MTCTMARDDAWHVFCMRLPFAHMRCGEHTGEALSDVRRAMSAPATLRTKTRIAGVLLQYVYSVVTPEHGPGQSIAHDVRFTTLLTCRALSIAGIDYNVVCGTMTTPHMDITRQELQEARERARGAPAHTTDIVDWHLASHDPELAFRVGIPWVWVETAYALEPDSGKRVITDMCATTNGPKSTNILGTAYGTNTDVETTRLRDGQDVHPGVVRYTKDVATHILECEPETAEAQPWYDELRAFADDMDAYFAACVEPSDAKRRAYESIEQRLLSLYEQATEKFCGPAAAVRTSPDTNE